ncbi:protein-L-isoaspartate O-methyltransferase family protein [Propionibacteriaceae bacterium G57]|uniref:protein-L-isoaspartate O-methyltransferase family protein n=1 Tax=Aestuariimicrobium sp. G57 TaxID=3418485 RepID=UPI003DA6DB6A
MTERPADREQVWTVLRTLRRTAFLPWSERRFADRDHPLPIGHGQTNSQPSTVVEMIALLEVVPGAKVLDVGCGSGWTTAILAALVGSSGRVFGVERIPDLTARARAAVAGQQLPWAEVHQAPAGVLGLPDEAPFDRILVSAMAGSMPQQLVDQLASPGVMVIPVGGVMHRVRKRADGTLSDTQHGLYLFVPLVTDEDDAWDQP